MNTVKSTNQLDQIETAPSKDETAFKSVAAEWVVTTQSSQWQTKDQLRVAPALNGNWDVEVHLDKPLQTIDGFGACLNELGWDSLSALNEADREAILEELFAPGVGANFNSCRMPIGANDFSRDWYSYDEVPGDFALEHFSISRDLELLVPFIKSALRYQPNLKLWASPWSPPTWMKYNKHYAGKLSEPEMPANGLRPDQTGKEGTDMFVQEDPYFKTYAAYFARFIKEYRSQGINIGMVMPQNEFNSPQPFPSCCWTPEGLARFISFLGPEMEKLNVEVFLGTMERPNDKLVDVPLLDPKSSKYIKGVGCQWASHTRDTYTLPRAEALSNRAGVRGRRERLAILPLGLDIDEDLPAKRSQRLLLLEYFSKAGRSQPMGMGAKFAGDG
jgi:glucosylceramidase